MKGQEFRHEPNQGNIEEKESFFIVYSPYRERCMNDYVRHANLHSAQDEAVKLASKFRTDAFYIMKVVDIILTNKPELESFWVIYNLNKGLYEYMGEVIHYETEAEANTATFKACDINPKSTFYVLKVN